MQFIVSDMKKINKFKGVSHFMPVNTFRSDFSCLQWWKKEENLEKLICMKNLQQNKTKKKHLN